MLRSILFLCLLTLSHNSFAVEMDHAAWASILSKHVIEIDGGQATQVDYAGIAEDRALLEKYLKQLSAVDRESFAAWSTDEQLAFLINTYNSWTVSFILTKYPELESIKDLGSFFRSPWKKQFIPLFGEQVSLDYIEHELIRGSGRYNDPRIHFAVNCASIGCPALKKEPYTGGNIQFQLQQATSLFLQDRSRNRMRDGNLQVSSLFKWYREDFEKGWMGITSLQQFLAMHAKDLGLNFEQAELLKKDAIKIVFLDYDWQLNRVK